MRVQHGAVAMGGCSVCRNAYWVDHHTLRIYVAKTFPLGTRGCGATTDVHHNEAGLGVPQQISNAALNRASRIRRRDREDDVAITGFRSLPQPRKRRIEARQGLLQVWVGNACLTATGQATPARTLLRVVSSAAWALNGLTSVPVGMRCSERSRQSERAGTGVPSSRTSKPRQGFGRQSQEHTARARSVCGEAACPQRACGTRHALP
eukprot:4307273-Prymnesium_polylepis.1